MVRPVWSFKTQPAFVQRRIPVVRTSAPRSSLEAKAAPPIVAAPAAAFDAVSVAKAAAPSLLPEFSGITIRSVEIVANWQLSPIL